MTGKDQAGLGLTAPQRLWQVNTHVTRVYAVIHSSLLPVKEVANSAVSLLLFNVLGSKTVAIVRFSEDS